MKKRKLLRSAAMFFVMLMMSSICLGATVFGTDKDLVREIAGSTDDGILGGTDWETPVEVPSYATNDSSVVPTYVDDVTMAMPTPSPKSNDDGTTLSVPIVTDVPATHSPTPPATPEPTPTPTPVPSESPKPSESPVPSESPKPSESPDPTKSPTPTESPVPSESPVPTETVPPGPTGDSNNLPVAISVALASMVGICVVIFVIRKNRNQGAHS